MEWDKHFTEGAGDVADDFGGNKGAQFMSEHEEKHMEKVQIVRCGKILWRSIIFGMYMFLVILVV